MLDKLITENYYILKDKAMQAGLAVTKNKSLIEDLFHDILLSLLANPNLQSMPLDKIKGYIYRAIRTNYLRSLQYCRNRQIALKTT